MTNTLHAHVETHSTDCDGPITREYVMTMTDEERTGEFGDIDFHNRVVSSIVNTYSLFQGGRLDVANLDSEGVTLDWYEVTEEGARNTHARICSDDCDTEVQSYRDHRAESMGY